MVKSVKLMREKSNKKATFPCSKWYRVMTQRRLNIVTPAPAFQSSTNAGGNGSDSKCLPPLAYHGPVKISSGTFDNVQGGPKRMKTFVFCVIEKKMVEGICIIL